MLEELRGPEPKGSETETEGLELPLKDSCTPTEGFELSPKGFETGVEGLQFETS